MGCPREQKVALLCFSDGSGSPCSLRRWETTDLRLRRTSVRASALRAVGSGPRAFAVPSLRYFYLIDGDDETRVHGRCAEGVGLLPVWCLTGPGTGASPSVLCVTGAQPGRMDGALSREPGALGPSPSLSHTVQILFLLSGPQFP